MLLRRLRRLRSSSSSYRRSAVSVGRRGWRSTSTAAAFHAQTKHHNHNRNHNHNESSYSNSNSSDRLLVVGSGVAGSATALVAAETHQIPVTMVYAGHLPTDCNSYWAQGGIIYQGRTPDVDSPELLASDIVRAGAGLCQLAAVHKVATEGPHRVRQLLLNDDPHSAFCNVPFERDAVTHELQLCLEASHSAARILFKADHTGRTITEYLTRAVANHPLITQLPHTIATDLIVADHRCVGVQTLSGKNLYAQYGTVLATGGVAGIYKFTTNPHGFNALGSSISMAQRAHVQLRDLEYIQFHPTALSLPNQPSFLLTEALRGEGAILRNHRGTAFAKQYHPDGELAPRDVVARAVFAQLKHGPVFLDITHRDSAWLEQRFPTICQHLREKTHGRLTLGEHMLPITPAAHYTCGGIQTNLHGQTSLEGCYAAGEAARTGLHGGNRLASTSLLEGLVFGSAVADHVAHHRHTSSSGGWGNVEASIAHHQKEATSSLATDRAWHRATTTPSTHVAAGHHADDAAEKLLLELKDTMWEHVGVARTTAGLQTAVADLQDLCEAANALHDAAPTPSTAAVRDAATAGHAVAQAALANPVSAGAHCLVVVAEDVDEEGGGEELLASASQ